MAHTTRSSRGRPCAGCGMTAPVGALMLYWHGMATVPRCSGSDSLAVL